MKKLLFLLGCLLLLLAAAAPASAAPAAADAKIQWQVLVDFHSMAGVFIVRLDYATMTWTDVDARGRYFTAVPADATDVRVGTSTAFVNSGDMAVFAKSFFQRLEVLDPGGRQIVNVDESAGQQYWTAMYRYNDWTSYYGPLLPYNPRIGAGMWAMDWIVPIPRPSGDATLRRGTYTINYSCMLTHRVADPMFPGRVPGREGYPPNGGPWGWTEQATLTFRVR